MFKIYFSKCLKFKCKPEDLKLIKKKIPKKTNIYYSISGVHINFYKLMSIIYVTRFKSNSKI